MLQEEYVFQRRLHT